MYELIYISVATKHMDESDLSRILNVARGFNAKNNITGMLIYAEREFVQLLEGEKEDVLALYNKIKNDARHSGVKLFHQGDIETRTFKKWSMAYQSITKDDEICQLPGIEKWQSGELPLNMVMESNNIGKELFLYLREDLQ